MAEHQAPAEIRSTPLHWRVRVCRWLWRVLVFFWGTLILGMVISIISDLGTTTTDTSLSKLRIIHLLLTYPVPIGSGLGLLAALTLLSWLGSREKQSTPARPLSEHDRTHMLRHLHVWYEQVLAQSLQGAVQLELGLTSGPAAVQNALSLALRLPDQPEQPLPPHTSIVQIYEQAQQELLILGEPGAGKSTLLLELARFLVEQAKREVTHPLPLLLPLSSWAERKCPLEEWLVEEIVRLYNVQRPLSRQWVQAEQVLPLLDGLDEMEEAARPACIAAINIYHRQHLRPFVVCSRTSEYDAATRHEQLALHTDVVVQALEARQVNAYLTNLGKPLAGLRAALKTNAILQELATTPLMLQVLMFTYRGTLVRTLPQQKAALQTRIWTDYIRRMIEWKGDVKRYPLPLTLTWLRWLASEMRQHNQAIFSLETLQPNWLPERQRDRYNWSARLAGGLISGLASGLVGGLAGGLSAGLIGGLLGAGIVFDVVFDLDNGRLARVEPTERLT